MPDLTYEALAAQVADLQRAMNELLMRVRGPLDPAVAVPPASPPAVTGPNDLPDPVPGEGFVSYAMRCADYVGGEKGAQAKRAAGSLFLSGQYLVNKHGGVWKAAVWEYIMGDPNYKPDPAWGTYRIGR